MRKAKIYLALLHYPMYNKRMDVVATSVTNLDLHDIARAARTYEVDGFYVVHPSSSQQALVKEVMSYWQEGYGGSYNPDRKEAFDLLHLAGSLAEVERDITGKCGQAPVTIATDAREYADMISYRALRRRIDDADNDRTFLLLFGTGWGIQKEIMACCHYILQPVEAGRSYNHLSVRSAVSIILDRLLGEAWFEA